MVYTDINWEELAGQGKGRKRREVEGDEKSIKCREWAGQLLM